MEHKGVIAAGHKETARAASVILESGGNAFDAIVAAHFAACVCEPVLASLGGGGYLLAHTNDNSSVVYDFFAQTPIQKRATNDLDFYPISADFGTATQEFHIGWGSVATPGTVKGLFTIHRELCTIPIHELMQPAISLAQNGVEVNSFQAYIFDIIHAIFTASPECKDLYKSKQGDDLARHGETLYLPELADSLSALAHEGDDLFYQGEIGRIIAETMKNNGGHLDEKDLSNYQVYKAKPLHINYNGTKILTNPPPSTGGILVAFALKLAEEINLQKFNFGSEEHLLALAEIMTLTNKARVDASSQSCSQGPLGILAPEYVSLYKKEILQRFHTARGTTHISIMDSYGNIASLTTSNGEGCGHLVKNTGIMLNNMLGEEDINPRGFHLWNTNERMASMMSPTLAVHGKNHYIALGSGGSNRIRTAILQVMINLIDFKMDLNSAVNSARIHCENDILGVENDFDNAVVKKLCERFPKNNIWQNHNLFFGGVHAVMKHNNEFSGVGDIRRGGVSVTV